ncbi:hsdl2 [Symbiodinium natans]|uniref:Hsdl2 protein n=1 Tax=Symbiodinium natans TaxID=878477 RepID=A0A812J641_9DINO|nr:hsdl2 [Symbiodinium natans]
MSELEKLGVQALPVKVDMRSLDDVKECVRQTVEKFGRIDILVNNASALWWQRIEDTPMNKYDLITQINARGSFALTHLCLPIMAKNGYGRVICMSPPIQTDFRAYKGFTAYNISKFGMTMAHGHGVRSIDPVNTHADDFCIGPYGKMPQRLLPSKGKEGAACCAWDAFRGRCPICFESFPGQSGSVIAVRCSRAHRFCRLCLAQHASTRRLPRCPGGGCDHELSDEELVEICGEGSEAVSSFRDELLLRAIFVLGDVVHCPNPCCASIISVEPGSGRQRVACCDWPAWCTTCRQPYHYAVDCCDVQALRDQWLQWVSHGRSVYNQTKAQHEEFERQKRALQEATERHAELKRDEEWKQTNCRECPQCRRVVQKIDGCNSMVCGQDAHGGNLQQGCGHRFQWNKARAYQAAPDSRQLPLLNVADVRVRGSGVRHPFCRCSRCKECIVGPRFRCIHCPDYNLCASCDGDASGAGRHPASHVFQILFKPEYDLRAYLPVGSRVVIADGSVFQGFEGEVQHEICKDVATWV